MCIRDRYYDARGANVAVGYEALYHNGQGSLFGDEGVANTAVGTGALRENTVASFNTCLLYTSPSPRDRTRSRMPSSA